MANNRLVNIDDAYEAVIDLSGQAETKSAYAAFWKAGKEIHKLPIVDAVEVVRCKDCDWYDTECESCKFWGGYRDPEHFCGEGDKKNHEGKAD